MDAPVTPCAIKFLWGALVNFEFFYVKGEHKLDFCCLERRCLGKGKDKGGIYKLRDGKQYIGCRIPGI